jgi:radical SAM superfamily enzyme YgiQ (UPF0313 family)
MRDAPAVLLINPNRMKPVVGPIGLDYLAEALAARGFIPHLVDLALDPTPRPRLKKLLARLRPVAVGITIRNVDDCYFASQKFLLGPVRSLVRWLKQETSAPVVLGGVGYSALPLPVLRWVGADIGLRGDGEEAFPLLLQALAAGKSFHDLPGVVLPDGTVNQLARSDLAALPVRRRNWIRNDRYFREGGQGNIETKRGCNRSCIFCADPVAKGRQVRRRPAELVAEELHFLLDQGVDTFHFCDCEFNVPREHAEDVCRAIIRRNLGRRIRWYPYAAPVSFDLELARLMARAGCAGVNFGVDSAADEQLERLGRNHRARDLETTLKACRGAGLKVMFDLLLGGPGETRATLRQTISWMKRRPPDRVGVSFGVRVFPGTALAGMIARSGPREENPNLAGRVRNNPDLLFPVFYVAESLGRNPEVYLHRLIGDDPRFFFASREIPERNYNYNDNRVLVQAIRRGARGAYWDILRAEA